MNSQLEQKLKAEILFVFYQKYSFSIRNICLCIGQKMTTIQSKSALISQIFLKLNEVKQIVNDFLLSFTINNEQIEPNLNGVFANKYDKI